MLQKIKIPLLLFFYIEKTKPIFFSCKNISINSFILYTQKQNIFLISIILKKDIFLSNNILLDNSGFNKNFNTFLFYIYFIYNFNIKLIILIFLKKKIIKSIEVLYNNMFWIERETSEMFGIIFFNKFDIRKLLLDYSLNETPLLHNYNTLNKKEYFYNYFCHQSKLFNK